MSSVDLIRILLLALAGLVGLAYAYQTIYLFLPRLAKKRAAVQDRPGGLDYAVLIAARNEEAVIPYLLDSIAAQDSTGGRLDAFVIADNCTDGTAAAARAHGATVYRRSDRSRIGKGYALQALLGHMRREGRLDDYDVFLVFDADNLLRPDYVSQMDRTFGAGYQAACGYRNSKNFMTNWITAGYGLWYAHDSAHFNASRMALGVTSIVTGTGFGFTRSLLDRWGGVWPFTGLTEDMQFDTWCALNDVQVAYCPGAMVYDEQVSGFAQSWRQRTRWIQGSIQIGRRQGAELLAGLVRPGPAKRRWVCFENMSVNVFGYALAVAANLCTAAAALLAGGPHAALTAALTPLAALYGNLFLVGAVTMLQERRNIPGGALRKAWACVTFPLFMFTFLPVGIWAFLSRPQWKPIRHTVAVGLDKVPTGAGRP